MAKYRFSHAERFAVWKHYGQQCYWCTEPLRLQDTTIDHVIPESLEEKPEEFARVRLQFQLPEDFRINSYGNWMPVHDACNRRKTNKTFVPAPILLAVLEKLQREAAAVREIEERVKANRKLDELIGKLLVAVEANALTREEILAAMADPELVENDDARAVVEELALHIDKNRWQVIHRNGDFATVSDGSFGGITPTSRVPDRSWECPHCGSYGPWNGVRCMSCGMMSDPWD